jgi:hypothetical protein
MKLIEAQLVLDEQPDEHAECDADAEAECVDEGIQFPFLYVPDGDFKVISYHDGVNLFYCKPVPEKYFGPEEADDIQHIFSLSFRRTMFSDIDIKLFVEITFDTFE